MGVPLPRVGLPQAYVRLPQVNVGLPQRNPKNEGAESDEAHDPRRLAERRYPGDGEAVTEAAKDVGDRRAAEEAG
jgi:hypothetical protein